MATVDNTQIRGEVQMELMKRTLKNQVVAEVENYILEQVMPDLKEKIHELALDAVGTWSIKMLQEQHMTTFDRVDKILVQFVEEVIKVHESPTIKIEKK